MLLFWLATTGVDFVAVVLLLLIVVGGAAAG